MAKVANMTAPLVGQANVENSGLAAQIDAARAVCAGSGCDSTKFAKTLICLLDVTSQLDELNVALRQAGHSNEQQILLSTMKFAQASLFEQQLHTIEVLEDLSSRGASIFKDPEGQGIDAPSGMVSQMAMPPGLSAPPGLAAPPCLAAPTSPLPAPAPSLSRATLLSLMPPAAMAKPEYGLKTVPAASLTASWKSSRTLRETSAKEAKSKVFVNKREVMAVNKKLAAVMASASDESDFEDACSTCSASSAFTSDAWDSE